jgi:8-oxo-dGTP pyrophosphatase MutT (NUDIX family)
MPLARLEAGGWKLDSSGESIVRRAARVLLIDSDERILLFHAIGADVPWLWTTPGGGLEPGESYARAARRELWEETGLHAEVGRAVWTRRHRYSWDGVLREARQRFFVVRCSPFEPDCSRWTAEESAEMDEHRWWTLGEIGAATDELFVPRRLAALLPPILRGEEPPTPIDCGV